MSPLQAGSLGAVGKLRARADFVHLRSHHPSFSVFEAWMAHSAEWAASRGGSAWPEAFREGGTQAFVFRTVTSGRDSAWLAGAMAPSSDQAGRLFPLAVALPLSAPAEVRAQPELLPLLLEPCWLTASELVSAALADPQYPLTEQLAGREALRQLDTVEAVSSLDEWIREATLTELWSLISAGGQLPNIPEALGWLSAVIRPVRGMEASDTPLSLRLPLGAAGGAAVCFWLALVRRLAGWRHTLPSFFWSHDGQRGSMLLHLGNPPRSTLSELWMPDQQRDEICDLSRYPMAQADLPPLETSLASLLQTPTVPLADLFAAATIRP